MFGSKKMAGCMVKIEFLFEHDADKSLSIEVETDFKEDMG